MLLRKMNAERFSPRQRIGLSVLACTTTALLAAPLSGLLDLANMVMLFLLTVLLVAISLGRNAAVVASILSVVLFDLFFVPPRFSFAVSNLQYLVTFAVMLATALITGHLTATLKQQAQDADVREKRTRALYEIARKLAGALSYGQVSEIVGDFIATEFKARSHLLLNDAPPPDWVDAWLAKVTRQTGRAHDSFARDVLYLPLTAPMCIRGVLVIRFGNPLEASLPENRALLATLTSLAAIALERLHYVEVAQESELKIATERLRSSILSALSHDLRTPLTVLVGLADSLSLVKPPLPARALEIADALHGQATRLAGLVTNLLEMARLNAGSVSLRQEWQPLEEVVGSSLKLLGSALSRHTLQVSLPHDLPLICFDAVLIERVLCNLLENAAKYSPEGTAITITARVAGEIVEVSVCDQGPGFPEEANDQLFGMFVRGHLESDKPGTGLGLAICRAIIEVHGGRIRVENLPEGGACVIFSLPRGEPPVLEAEAT
jgi:two-component system sensor histidine kinase KdpD